MMRIPKFEISKIQTCRHLKDKFFGFGFFFFFSQQMKYKERRQKRDDFCKEHINQLNAKILSGF